MTTGSNFTDLAGPRVNYPYPSSPPFTMLSKTSSELVKKTGQDWTRLVRFSTQKIICVFKANMMIFLRRQRMGTAI